MSVSQCSKLALSVDKSLNITSTNANEASGSIRAQLPQPVFCAASAYRSLRNVFGTIFHDYWKTRSSMGGVVSIIDSQRLDSAPEIQENPQLKIVIQKLNHTGYLNSSAIRSYANYLKGKFSNFNFYSGCLSNRLPTWEHLPGHEECIGLGVRLLAIPVVIRSYAVNHVVLFMIDLGAGCLEFYDSKGLTLSDRAGTPLLCDENLDLPALARMLLLKYTKSNPMMVLENDFKHQQDNHNCGVFVCDYLRRRCYGEPAISIFQNGKSYEEINFIVRLKVMQELVPSIFK